MEEIAAKKLEETKKEALNVVNQSAELAEKKLKEAQVEAQKLIDKKAEEAKALATQKTNEAFTWIKSKVGANFVLPF